MAKGSAKNLTFLLDTLARESDRLSGDIRNLEGIIDKCMGFGIAVIGFGFTYGVKEDILAVFIFIPIATLGLLFFAMDRLRGIMWLGGYKRAVEDKINKLSGTTVTKWEELVQEHRGNGDVIKKSVALIYFILFGGICLFCIYRTFVHKDAVQIMFVGLPLAGVILCIILIILSSLFVIAMREKSFTYQLAYKRSVDLLNKKSIQKVNGRAIKN